MTDSALTTGGELILRFAWFFHRPWRGKTKSVNRFIGDSVYRKSKRGMTEDSNGD